ncbi:MAG: hypothetical protein ACD_7C00295G0001 [uncultured bacterium]|nr:MAG: hypothetical protein ACD_7C00295G0001 [uncultured bacterium]
MINPIRIHRVSFRHAFDGIIHNVKTQPNFRFHLLAAISTILAGIYFSLGFFEWLILIFTFNMVFVAEMLNTSVEAIVDLITVEKRIDAKIAKDVSAGMVLISASLSLIIGVFIFLPKIISTLYN